MEKRIIIEDKKIPRLPTNTKNLISRLKSLEEEYPDALSLHVGSRDFDTDSSIEIERYETDEEFQNRHCEELNKEGVRLYNEKQKQIKQNKLRIKRLGC